MLSEIYGIWIHYYLFLLPSATKLRRSCFYRCLPQCMLGYHTPQSRHPLGADTPQEQTPPWSRQPPEWTPPGADTPLAADTPPGADTPLEQTPHPQSRQTPSTREQTPPPRDTVTAADGTHPTGMHSCWHKMNEFLSITTVYTAGVSVRCIYSSGSSGRVRGGTERREIYAAIFGGHLFMTYFYRAGGEGGHGPFGLLIYHDPNVLLSISSPWIGWGSQLIINQWV